MVCESILLRGWHQSRGSGIPQFQRIEREVNAKAMRMSEIRHSALLRAMKMRSLQKYSDEQKMVLEDSTNPGELSA